MKKALSVLLTLLLCCSLCSCRWVNSIQNKTEVSDLDRLRNARVGEYVYFGSYEQDNNKFNGSEKIEWKVLEIARGKMLLVSKYAVECDQFNRDDTNKWAESTLREWLNGTFVKTAFSVDEETALVTTSRTTNGTYSEEKVFLLSAEEVECYFDTEADRRCRPSLYANAMGVAVEESNGCCVWFLRSAVFGTTDCIQYVNTDGSINGRGAPVFFEPLGVRPAIWISIE